MSPEPAGGWWINTATGRRFPFLAPAPSDIDILDIAIALSHQARYAGHTRTHYSVASHSVVVSRVVWKLGGSLDERRWGLLHDAAEAYVTDIPWPLKAAGLVPGLKDAEASIMDAIRWRFDLSDVEPQIVRDIDLEMLEVESDTLLVRHRDWQIARPARPEVREQFRFRPGPDLVAEQFLSEAIECGLCDKGETWARWHEWCAAVPS